MASSREARSLSVGTSDDGWNAVVARRVVHDPTVALCRGYPQAGGLSPPNRDMEPGTPCAGVHHQGRQLCNAPIAVPTATCQQRRSGVARRPPSNRTEAIPAVAHRRIQSEGGRWEPGERHTGCTRPGGEFRPSALITAPRVGRECTGTASPPPSAEQLGLLGLELFVGDDTLGLQVGQFGQLVHIATS